jgi:hypothetical protein
LTDDEAGLTEDDAGLTDEEAGDATAAPFT